MKRFYVTLILMITGMAVIVGIIGCLNMLSY